MKRPASWVWFLTISVVLAKMAVASSRPRPIPLRKELQQRLKSGKTCDKVKRYVPFNPDKRTRVQSTIEKTPFDSQWRSSS